MKEYTNSTSWRLLDTKYIGIYITMSSRFAFTIWTCCFLLYIVETHGLKAPTVRLSDGNAMPIVGFGTHFRKATQEETTYFTALDVGYRHFDTAYNYYNEKSLGRALNKWLSNGGKREDLFITSKLPPQGLRASDVETYLKMSLKNLGLDYLDMYLIHIPCGMMKNKQMGMSIFDNGTYEFDPTTDHIAVWKEMEKQVKAGLVRSIGLSNFNKTQILKIYNHAEIKPTSLEIEYNLYLQQEELVKLSQELDIVITAYSPLGSNSLVRKTALPSLMKHPLVQKFAEKYDTSPAQIILRYSVQNGIVVIPNSSNRGRMTDNLNIFHFSLTQEDMASLKTLDEDGKVRKFTFLEFIGIENHPEYPFSYLLK